MLSSDYWDADGTFAFAANVWWRTNTNTHSFYDGEVLLATGTPVPWAPCGQNATLNLTGQAKGRHTYRVELANDAGSTSDNSQRQRRT